MSEKVKPIDDIYKKSGEASRPPRLPPVPSVADETPPRPTFAVQEPDLETVVEESQESDDAGSDDSLDALVYRMDS